MKRPMVCVLMLAVVLLSLGCAEGTRSEPEPERGDTLQPARSVPDYALVRDLRQGGYVIYFCNAATEPGGAGGPENLGNREAQRNLSEDGRSQAAKIGEAFRELEIPVGEVLSSPYFRALDTARIALGRAEPTGELLGLRSNRSVQHPQRQADLLRLLSTPPPKGTNTVLVSHASNAEEYAGIPLDEGEAAVLKPLGDDEFEFVARITPEDWKELSESMRGDASR
jgi:phosphohistidine phosphatase SixA